MQRNARRSTPSVRLVCTTPRAGLMTVDELSRNLVAYRAVFEMAQHGVVLCDPEGRIEAWNGSAASLTGRRAEEAIGQDLAWLHRQDEAPWMPDAVERATRGEAVVHAGWRRRADGSRYWCEAALHALRDDDGELCGFAEAFGDTTAVKSANDALREAPALFDRALRSAPIGLATQDADLRYTWVPVGVAALGGAAGGDVLGCEDADLYPADAAGRLTAFKRAVIDSARGLRTEIQVERDAETRHYDVTLEPLRGEDGAVLGVSTVAFDVTDRKRVEEELERSRARLAEAEHVARLGSWEWDIAANRVVWSDGLYAIYGVGPEDFDPRYRPSSERVHPEDRERLDAEVRRAIETCEPIDLEYRIVRPDGRVRRLQGRAEVIADADGRPVRLTGTARDITEVRATAEALNQAAAELGRRAAGLQRLTGPSPPTGDGFDRVLTARQLEIVGLVADGLSNAEIAGRLFLSEGTVKWHVRKILRALGVSNRAQAVARYLAARSLAPD
ncbi:MAG: PAS domain-containing protein [Solirubrobacteraceae bacterium]